MTALYGSGQTQTHTHTLSSTCRPHVILKPKAPEEEEASEWNAYRTISLYAIKTYSYMFNVFCIQSHANSEYHWWNILCIFYVKIIRHHIHGLNLCHLCIYVSVLKMIYGAFVNTHLTKSGQFWHIRLCLILSIQYISFLKMYENEQKHRLPAAAVSSNILCTCPNHLFIWLNPSPVFGQQAPEK